MHAPRRTRLPGDRNHHLYTRADGRLEVGFRDGSGKQRWRVVPGNGGVQAARAMRDALLGARVTGEAAPRRQLLKFGDAADTWLEGPVRDLRPATQRIYRNAIENHLRRRFGGRKLDDVRPDDLAAMVREMRAAGLSEWTIQGVLGAANQVFKYAARRLDWAKPNPVGLLLTNERPKVASTKRKAVFTADQVADVIRASDGRWRVFFLTVAVTGARLSEVLGLTWDDVDMGNAEAATITFAAQVDGDGVRQPLKTTDSHRRVPIPPALASALRAHRLASRWSGDGAFVFSTASGRPLSQRNAARALRAAQKRARTLDGAWSFPALHTGQPVARGVVPSIHSFRHAYASQWLAAGQSVDDVAYLLGHRDATVTRRVYLHEVNDAHREAQRRNLTAQLYGSALEAASHVSERETAADTARNVRLLRGAS